MIKTSIHFQYEIPDSWTELCDGQKYIYQGHNQEEFIISGFSVEGTGSPVELLMINEQIFSNAVKSVHHAAAHPDLQVEGELARVTGTKIPIWRLSSITTDKAIVFLQAIVRGEKSLLLVTFEAPNNEYSRTLFDVFLNSINAV